MCALRRAQDPGSIQLSDALTEGVIDDLEIAFRMSRREEAGEPVLNVNSTQTQVIEQQRCQWMLVVDIEEEPAREALHLRLQSVLGEQLVEVGGEYGRALRQRLLQLGSLA